MNNETFIFVHDQQIVLDYLKVNKFNQLKNVKYVFLGDKNISEIKNIPNLIVCRDLPINIEKYPKLTSFTGWYAIWKNKLYNEDYVNLFEYDINLLEKFTIDYANTISENPSIIGYIPLDINHYNFLGHKPWAQELIKSIEKNYNIDVLDYVKKLSKESLCSMTSNHTFSKKSFEDYMIWVEPIVEDIKKSHLCGHHIERSISTFYLLNKIQNVRILPNVLEHFQFDSHETQGINKEKFESQYSKLL
jgi:hypothetical protein